MFSLRNSAISPWNFSEKLAVLPEIFRFCVRLFLNETKHMGSFLHLICICSGHSHISLRAAMYVSCSLCDALRSFLLQYTGLPIVAQMYVCKACQLIRPTITPMYYLFLVKATFTLDNFCHDSFRLIVGVFFVMNRREYLAPFVFSHEYWWLINDEIWRISTIFIRF